MAETKTTSTRGRKPKEVVEDINIKETKKEEVSISDLMAKLEEQAKQMAELQNKVNATTKEKSTLETLVKTLKSNDNKEGTRNLPKKVKLVSLIPNKYNLTTEDGGHGKVFTFEGIDVELTGLFVGIDSIGLSNLIFSFFSVVPSA